MKVLKLALASLALGACSATTSNDLATQNLNEKIVAASLRAEVKPDAAPYIGVLHIPIGVTAEAQDLYATTFLDWLVQPIDNSVAAPSELEQAHHAFIKSNGLTAPLKSGLDLGAIMAEDEDFLIAHYVVSNRDGKLARDYLDDPDAYPPSLVHADLQLFTEPRDELLKTGPGDVLTLGTIGAPVLALSQSPDFSDVFATSDELSGTTFLELMYTGPGKAKADISTEMVSLVPENRDEVRQLIRSLIIAGVNEHSTPAGALEDDKDWFAYYGLDAETDEATIAELSDIEASVINARGSALRKIIDGQAGGALEALKIAESRTYNERREIAAKQNEAFASAAFSLLTTVAGAGAGGSFDAFSNPEAALGLAETAIDGIAESIEALDGLNDAALDVAEAFGGFYSNSIEKNVGDVVETEFGRIDARKGLTSLKPEIRASLRGPS